MTEITDTRAVVLFAGDSNVNRCAGAIATALCGVPFEAHWDDSYVPALAGHAGALIRGTYWQGKVGSVLAKAAADAVVTELGINDTAFPCSAGSLATGIDAFMGAAGSRPVFWTNLPTDLEPAARQANCDIVNQALGDACGRWANLTVLDWHTAAAGHVEYMADVGVDVHLSDAGQAAWAALVVSALDARFPGPTVPAAPAAPAAVGGSGQATVTWAAPSTGGASITGYTVTPYVGWWAGPPRLFDASVLSQTLTGLTNGWTYRFKVAASNLVGTGPQSTVSNAVVPAP